MRHALACFVLAAALGAGGALAQTANGPVVSFTATTDNTGGARDAIRINLLRWSTDAERDQMLAAWALTGAPATGGRGGAGRGAGTRVGANAALDDDDPALAGVNPAASARGGAGRGGRGGGRGGAGGPAAPRQTPESSLKTALDKAPTLGYLWSPEVAGYSLRYAVRLAEPDGGERILLITDRRLGAWSDLWKPAGAGTATDYEFSLIELHVNAKGEGEGKISLTGKVTVDNAAKTIALENYGALPVVLKNVRRRTS